MDKKLADLISRLLPVPYLHEGRSYSGLDCGGLILTFFREYRGIVLPDMLGYDSHWGYKGKNYFIENYFKFFDPVRAPQLMDVVLFFNGKKVSDHGGVVLRDGRFIHCHRHVGVSVDRLGADPWAGRLAGFYRLRQEFEERFRGKIDGKS